MPSDTRVIATGVAIWLANDDPPRGSYRWTEPRPAAAGHLASTRADLRALAEDAAADDLIPDLFADMRIAGHAISREEMLGAPHRIELSPELEARIPD